MKTLLCLVGAIALSTARAEDGAARWHFSAGPAWRASVKSSVRGDVSVPAAASSHTVSYDGEVAEKGDWQLGDTVRVPDPETPGYDLYAVPVTRTETTISSGRGIVSLGSEERDAPLGLRTSAGYDFYAGERFSAGLNLVFAAYWDLRSSASGTGGGGSCRVQTSRDYYLFENGPYPDDADFSFCSPSATPYAPYHEELGDVTEAYPTQRVRARFRSDLYQIGLGPRLAWHALDRLDVYAEAEALCNLLSVELSCGAAEVSETQCRLGFGGTVGVQAALTECLSLYAETGYEWVDEADLKIRGVRAEIDCSSLVVSAGLRVSF